MDAAIGENLIKIGQGTYSTVYAVDDHLVVKCIQRDPYFSSAIREITITNACNHTNIIKILNIEYYPEFIKIFMKRYQCDLHQVICELELTFDTICGFTNDLFSACAYIHKIGIIHGDLKPQNLLIDSTKLLLCDFGVATLSCEKYHNNHVQTCIYRAPEVKFDPDKKLIQYSNLVDIWSVGCIIYEMCTNEPFAMFVPGIEDSSWYACKSFEMSTCNSRKERIKILRNLDFTFVYKYLCDKLSKHRFYSMLRDNKIIYIMANCLIPNPKKRISAEAALMILHDKPFKNQNFTRILMSAVTCSVFENISNDVIHLTGSGCLQFAESLFHRCVVCMEKTENTEKTEIAYACIYAATCIFSTLSKKNIKEVICRYVKKSTIDDIIIKIMKLFSGNLL